jgi:hypothetical protein
MWDYIFGFMGICAGIFILIFEADFAINPAWQFSRSEWGPCEECGRPGWKQFSHTDPLSPLLLILCEQHHMDETIINRDDIHSRHITNK